MISIKAVMIIDNFMTVVMELNIKRKVSMFGLQIEVNELEILTICLN